MGRNTQSVDQLVESLKIAVYMRPLTESQMTKFLKHLLMYDAPW